MVHTNPIAARIGAHTSGIAWLRATMAPEALKRFCPYMRHGDVWSQTVHEHIAALVLPDIDTIILIDDNMRTCAYDMRGRAWRELSTLRLMAGYERKALAMHETEWLMRES